ncbi:hypothetical protein [Melissococcus plutonius]|nr:hypothetical protein [Melissococcus plutonius]MBB5177694.1 hypothetical protein [Melissococcus plutonius]
MSFGHLRSMENIEFMVVIPFDFINFDSPFLFAEKEYDIIDSTIIHEDGYFYRFTKNEKNKRIILEKAPQLFGNYEEIYSPVLNQLAGVEGPEVYQVEEHLWYLILDRFMEGKGYNLLSTKNLSSGEFTIFPEGSYDFGKNKKRHGGVMAITTEEYQRLQSHYN